jgi:hypothetical protein
MQCSRPSKSKAKAKQSQAAAQQHVSKKTAATARAGGGGNMGQGLAEQGRVKGEERVVVDNQLLLGCLSACSAVSLFCHVVRHRVASVIAACML